MEIKQVQWLKQKRVLRYVHLENMETLKVLLVKIFHVHLTVPLENLVIYLGDKMNHLLV